MSREFVLHRVFARYRSRLRALAVRFGGLPHSVGTVDSPPPLVASDISRLWHANLCSRQRIVDRLGEEVVTMTSHGERLATVWLAIESIGRGERRPRRMILWLDGPRRRLPARLRRLVRRGLEVEFVPRGMGVHTKYWHYLRTQHIAAPLVLSDDDIIYPPDWLSRLHERHIRHPQNAIAFRAHRVALDENGRLLPYAEWTPCTTTVPSYAHFATSVAGQLLPAALQRAILAAGTAFLSSAPTADDVWVHTCAVESGFRVEQVEDVALHWWFIPGSQTSGLNTLNVAGGANDRQLAASHTPQTLARIREDAARVP